MQPADSDIEPRTLNLRTPTADARRRRQYRQLYEYINTINTVAVVTIDPRDPTPIYAQLERALRAAIATGRLAAGDQLPTVRQLAVDLRINANTVARVYAELERAGVLETRRGRRVVRHRRYGPRAPAS